MAISVAVLACPLPSPMAEKAAVILARPSEVMEFWIVAWPPPAAKAVICLTLFVSGEPLAYGVRTFILPLMQKPFAVNGVGKAMVCSVLKRSGSRSSRAKPS